MLETFSHCLHKKTVELKSYSIFVEGGRIIRKVEAIQVVFVTYSQHDE